MATISEISGASNYTGNAALGGYIPSAIEIDTKPLQTLAAYTVMQNKSLFDQRQKDADEQILELANITQFDASNAVPKDKEEVTRYVAEYMQKAKERAQQGTPKSPSEKLSNKFKWESETMIPVQKIKDANARGLARVTQLSEIDKKSDLNPESKKILRDEVNRMFNETGLDDPIPSLSKFTPSLPKIGEPIYSKIQTNAKDANGNYEGTFEFFNSRATNNQSNLETTGFNDILPANATADQKLEFALRQAQGGTKKVWDDMGVSFNAAINNDKYKLKGADGLATGEVDVEALKRDIPFVGNLYAAIDKFNEYNRQGKEDATRGYYSTKAGKNVNILNVVSVDDFYEMDKTKPLTPADLSTLQKFLVANPTSKKEQYTFTGEANTRLNILTDAATARRGQDIQLSNLELEAAKSGMAKDKNGKWGLIIGVDKNNVSIVGNAYDKLVNDFTTATANSSVGKKAMRVSELEPSLVYALEPKLVVVNEGVLSLDPIVIKDDIWIRKDNSGNFTFQTQAGVEITDLKGVRRKNDIVARGTNYIETINKETKGQQTPYQINQDSAITPSNNNVIIVNGKRLITPQ